MAAPFGIGHARAVSPTMRSAYLPSLSLSREFTAATMISFETSNASQSGRFDSVPTATGADEVDRESRREAFKKLELPEMLVQLRDEAQSARALIKDLQTQVLQNNTILHQLYNRQRFSMKDVVAHFQKYDTTGDKCLDADQFQAFLSDAGVELSPVEFTMLWRKLDGEQESQITVGAFEKMFTEQAKMQEKPNLQVDEVLRLAIEAETREIQNCIGSGGEVVGHNIQDIYPHAPYSTWPVSGSCGDFLMSMHFTMEDETFSLLSHLLFVVMMSLVTASTVALALETESQFSNWYGWVVLEYIVSIFITIEIALRLLACRNPFGFWDVGSWYLYDPMNVVDFLAAMPLYVSLIFDVKDEILFIIHVLRLFRVARLRRFTTIQMSYDVIYDSAVMSISQAGALVTSIVALEVLVFSSFMFIVERGEQYPWCPNALDFARNNATWCTRLGTSSECTHRAICESALPIQVDPRSQMANKCEWTAWDECVGRHFRSDGSESPFVSIPKTIWFTMATITTVGYGDMAPIESLGRLVGCITMLTGVVVVSLYVVVFAGNFEVAKARALRRITLSKRTLSKRKTGGASLKQRSIQSLSLDSHPSSLDGRLRTVPTGVLKEDLEESESDAIGENITDRSRFCEFDPAIEANDDQHQPHSSGGKEKLAITLTEPQNKNISSSAVLSVGEPEDSPEDLFAASTAQLLAKRHGSHISDAPQTPDDAEHESAVAEPVKPSTKDANPITARMMDIDGLRHGSHVTELFFWDSPVKSPVVAPSTRCMAG